MNKEQKRYLKEIKALMPVYGKYEKRFFHDIKDSICELDAEHITYEMLCLELGRPEDLIVNYYQEIDSTYLRKQLKRTRSIKAVVLIIVRNIPMPPRISLQPVSGRKKRYHHPRTGCD